MSISA